MTIDKKYFIVLDIETTGFDRNTEEIIEIAAIKVDSDSYEIIDIYETLIKNEKHISIEIEKLTGINDGLLEYKGIDVKDALEELVAFCDCFDVIAHYSPFDKGFIRHNLMRQCVYYEESQWINSIKIFKEAWPNMKNYKLNTLIKHFNLAKEEDHRALSDARHTLTLLKLARKK